MNRNEPCFCGSGKNFKRCHGLPTAPAGAESLVRRSEIARANASKALDAEINDELIAYARSRFGRQWFVDVIAEFVGAHQVELLDEEHELFNTWMLFHRFDNDTNSLPLGEAFRRDRRLYREPAKNQLVAAQLASTLGVWEVQSVEMGIGLQLRDLLSGEERFVYDVTTSNTVTQWHAVLAYVVDVDGISFFASIHGQLLMLSETADVVRIIKKLARVRTRFPSLAFRSDPDIQFTIVEIWNETIGMRDMAMDDMVMQNTDGHIMAPQTDHYELRGSRASVLKQLCTITGAEESEPEGKSNVIVVLQHKKPGDTTPGMTLIAKLVLSDKKLTIETNSVERADAIKAAVDAVAGTLLHYRLRKSESLDTLRDQMQHTPPPLPAFGTLPENMPPEVMEMMKSFLAQHNATWPDIGLPALDGKTPREAAKSPKMKPRLVALHKDMEIHDVKQPEAMRMDIPAIRRELKL